MSHSSSSLVILLSSSATPLSSEHANPPRSALFQGLEQCRSTLIVSLHALSPAPNPPITPHVTTLSSLPRGLSDVLAALLTSLRQTTTSLALSFKPPLTPSTVVPLLLKLSDEFARITSCVLALPANTVILTEWREGATSIGDELKHFVDVLSGKLEAPEEDGYLTHTGMVWEALDRFADFSTDEVGAVRKRLEGQKGIMKDAWDEFNELLEGDVGEGGLDLEDEEDDELGGSFAGTMSAEERTRAEAVRLGFAQSAHK